MLVAGGAVGVATWGPDYPVRATEVWHDELDRHGAETLVRNGVTVVRVPMTAFGRGRALGLG